jgi:phospholipid/cholesterol/gamma-HCH transport system substrate-binding protein
VRAGALLVVAGALVLSGCSVLSGGVYETPLPGGADVGDHPMTITADFADVLDLVPQASVKVDEVAVGRVADISLNDDGRSAHVELVVDGDVDLPAGTTARLRQTALLGEKYVALVRPADPDAGPALASGAHLGIETTSQAAEVEQVLGALSLVLNGGGIGQFREISRELQAVSTGRPEEIEGFLDQLETFVGSVDARKESVTAALDGLAQLSQTLDADRDKIASALEGLSPGMQVVVDQRDRLVEMLRALDRLSRVTIRTLDASQDDIVADLELLRPVLDKLAQAGSDLPRSLEILLTYPFPDSVLGAIGGDYLNVFVTTNFRSTPVDCRADISGCSWPQVAAPQRSIGRSGGGSADPLPTLLPPTSSALPGLAEPTVTLPVAGASGTPSPTTTPSGTASSSPSGAPSGTPSGSPSGSPSGTPSGTGDPSPGVPTGSSSDLPTAGDPS